MFSCRKASELLWYLFRSCRLYFNYPLLLRVSKQSMSMNFCRVMLCKRGLCRHVVYVCVSACLSHTFVNSVKTTKRSYKIFSPSGSHTVLVFKYQTSWRYSDGNPHNGGVECMWGRQKSRFWANIWLHRMLRTVGAASAIHSSCDGPWWVDDTSRR